MYHNVTIIVSTLFLFYSVGLAVASVHLQPGVTGLIIPWPDYTRDVNKDLTPKDQDKDLTPRTRTRTRT